MKLRCTENSIRIRIRKSELKELAEKGKIAEHVHFANTAVFTFSLNLMGGITGLSAMCLSNNIMVTLPKKQAMTWMNTNQVGLEANYELDEGQTLHILVEKDFPCLDRENEDKSDTFWELASDTPDAC